MKLKLLMFCLVITSVAFSQSIDAVIDARVEAKVNQLVDAKLSAFAKTLDSSVTKIVTATGTVFIDTIKQVSNQNNTYLLTLNGEVSTGTKLTAIRAANVNTLNGVTTIVSQTAIKGFTGTGAFEVVVVNNICLVKITLTSATQKVKWTYKRTNI